MIRSYKFIFVLLLISCGSDEPLVLDQPSHIPISPCSSSMELISREVIIDDLIWDDYLDLKDARAIKNSQSTGQIRIPTINASCTAFLVNENTIMTNNHCVPNQHYDRGVRFLLRDESKLRESFYCETLLATNAALDFSLLECDGYPGDKYGHIPLNKNIPQKNQSMYLVQENCDYLSDPRCSIQKYVAKGKLHRVSQNSLAHDADTLGGSSGSPIFDQETHQLIGIHHAGMSESGTSPGMNFGIPMHRIAHYLNDHYPEIKFYQNVVIDDQDDSLIDGCL
jgi:hypothetical protein